MLRLTVEFKGKKLLEEPIFAESEAHAVFAFHWLVRTLRPGETFKLHTPPGQNPSYSLEIRRCSDS